MISCDTIVFDFNGTILDDRDLCIRILNEMLEMQGHEPVSVDRYVRIFTFPIINYYKAAGFKFEPEGHDDFPYLANIFVEKYNEGFINETSMFPDVKDFLQTYKGKKKLVCLSASKQSMLDEGLKHIGIYDVFDDIIGIKDIYAVSKLEEARQYFESTKEDMGKVLFIGDTLHDVEVAKTLGAKIMLIARGHQHVDVLEKGGSDAIVYSFEEAKQHIN